VPVAVPAPVSIPAGADVALPAPVSIPLPGGISTVVHTLGELATAVVGVGAAAVAITSEFDSCAVTTCAGPNQLQGLLGSLLGLVGLAEFGAFLEQVITNPAGAEQQYSSLFAGIVTPLVSGGGDVWSAIESVLDL
jgi:hypothetical protein